MGLGGVLAELHAEVAATPLPTTPAMLRDVLSRNARLDKLMNGYRGQPGVERDAVIAFLVSFVSGCKQRATPSKRSTSIP